MHEVVDEKRSPSKKPFIFYAIIALLIIMLLNALVFPSMLQRSVIEVGYDQFLEMIDSGEVKEVSYDESSGPVSYTHLARFVRQDLSGRHHGSS